MKRPQTTVETMLMMITQSTFLLLGRFHQMNAVVTGMLGGTPTTVRVNDIRDCKLRIRDSDNSRHLPHRAPLPDFEGTVRVNVCAVATPTLDMDHIILVSKQQQRLCVLQVGMLSRVFTIHQAKGDLPHGNIAFVCQGYAAQLALLLLRVTKHVSKER